MANGAGSNRSQNVATSVLALAAYATALGFNGPGANLLLLTCAAGALLLWMGVLIWRDMGAGGNPPGF